jgi:hypothetical protein
MTELEERVAAALMSMQDRTNQQAQLSSHMFDEAKLLFKEAAELSKEATRLHEEVARENREYARNRPKEVAETDRQLRELKAQIAGLSNKFGGFTEGLALPSMTKILTQQFQMDVVTPRVLSRRNGRSFEVDVMAYSHFKVNKVYIVEVKSRLRLEDILQMKRILREFREFFPLHQDKDVHGILAVVDAHEQLRKKVLEEGIYLARIHDEEFEIDVPADFQPRTF